jgi:hypothetical protein
MKIICPVSSENKIEKVCRKSLDALRRLGYKVEIVESFDPITASDAVDLNEQEHLFIDSDIGPFGQEEINILQGSHCEVVSGAYSKCIIDKKIIGNRSWWQGGNNVFVAGKWGEQLGMAGSFVENTAIGLIPVDFCGTGFLYIKTSAINKILDCVEMPLFCHYLIKSEKLPFGRGQTANDLGFSMNCQKAGLKIWLQCACRVNHIRRSK